MTKKLIPLAAVEKIIRQIDPKIRVSDDAKIALRDVLQEKASKISQKAWKMAVHAGRKTIKEEDVKLACQE